MDDDHLFIDSNQHNPVVVFFMFEVFGRGYDEWFQIFFQGERETHTQRQKKTWQIKTPRQLRESKRKLKNEHNSNNTPPQSISYIESGK